MKEVMSVSFYKTYLEIQKFNHLILVGIPSSLILFEGGGFTYRQNLSSMTKVICHWSLEELEWLYPINSYILISYKFFETQRKKGMIFSLILVGFPYSSILSVKNRMGEFT